MSVKLVTCLSGRVRGHSSSYAAPITDASPVRSRGMEYPRGLVGETGHSPATKMRWVTLRAFDPPGEVEPALTAVENGLVSVSVVTFNSGSCIRQCLASVQDQTYSKVELIVVDNASDDGVKELIEAEFPSVKVIWNSENTGFCHAHNQAISSSRGEYALILNPDVVLESNFIACLVGTMVRHPEAGAATGKLLRMKAHKRDIDPARIDHTGFFPLRSGSPWDRGAGQLDRPEWHHSGEVFGVTGAAGFYRRAALESVREGSEYFDETFFVYAEDIDLAWRLRLRGWSARYEPRAVAWHVRKSPSNASRRSRGRLINYHLTKNRYLVMLKNYPISSFLRNAVHIFAWTLAALAYIFLFERESISGIRMLIRLLPQALARRRMIRQRRRVSGQVVLDWFREAERLRMETGVRTRWLIFERARQLFEPQET